MIQGHAFLDKITKVDRRCVRALFAVKKGNIPKYVRSLWKHMLKRVTGVHINRLVLTKNVVKPGLMYGLGGFEDLYFSGKTNCHVKWEEIFAFYPNCNLFQIMRKDEALHQW